MFSFSGLHGTVNGRGKFENIEAKSCEDVCKIAIAYVFVTKKNGNGPPKTKAVHAQQSCLRNQCLRAMPTHKIGSFSVGNKKEKCSNQVDDW